LRLDIPDFSERSTELELMDGSDYTVEEMIDTLAELRRVNHYLGGHRALTRHLFPMIERLGRPVVRLLDIGTGSADIPIRVVEWARSRKIKVKYVVVDLNPIVAEEARQQVKNYPEIEAVCGNALNLPFAAGAFDFVTASLFLHHFETPNAAELLRALSEKAGVALIINDLRRHPVAYYSINILTQIFTRNRLVRNDAGVSVLRSFTERDIEKLSEASGLRFDVHRHFPYRYILINRNRKENNSK
jgi:ubiquinone/menaquinone biosynthesis C-methylase UbiE